MWQRVKYFLNPIDVRYEDYSASTWKSLLWRDISAGLITAMMAIPMAMGFAIAAGLKPEHGILAGAVSGIVGGLLGGSKYNVYGPVAALIPVVAEIIGSRATPSDPYAGHGFLVLICMCSGPLLMFCAAMRWGRFGNLVPHSIVVGFSVGIAVSIAVSQLGEVLGLTVAVKGSFLTQIRTVVSNIGDTNIATVGVAALTFVVTHSLLKISRYIPAPLIALAVATGLSSTLLAGRGLALIKTKYGEIPTNFLMFSPPTIPDWSFATLCTLGFYSLVFAFVCGFESVLCARMADRLADNRRTPYDPDREFFGQGVMLLLVPMLKGMPLSGALARTATKVQVGAASPLSEILKSVLKLLLAYFLARYLEQVPMACIGGLLLWVSVNMVKPAEIRSVWHTNRFHGLLMVYTGVMVIFTGFLTGVISALGLYAAIGAYLSKAGHTFHLQGLEAGQHGH